MKNIYICDFMGEPEAEAESIELQLGIPVKHVEDPNFEGMKFDTLFFDWGGASMGNSLMQSFLRRILKHAAEHPSRMYVMTSRFTELAMRDMIREVGEDKPANVFLNLDDYRPFAKL